MKPGPSEVRDHLVKIGNICWQWSMLEFSVAGLIWRLLGIDPDTGKIVTGGLDMIPRLNMAINLARHMKAPRYVTDELAKVRKAIQDGLDAERNRAVHGVNFPPNSAGEFLVEMHRGKGPKTPVAVTTAELDNLGKRLNALCNDMFLLHNRTAEDPKFAAARAIALKMRTAAADTDSESGSKSQSA